MAALAFMGFRTWNFSARSELARHVWYSIGADKIDMAQVIRQGCPGFEKTSEGRKNKRRRGGQCWASSVIRRFVESPVSPREVVRFSIE